jgi:hypothetical protein
MGLALTLQEKKLIWLLRIKIEGIKIEGKKKNSFFIFYEKKYQL